MNNPLSVYSEAIDGRSASRASVRLMAKLAIDSENHCDIIIHNLSAEGFRFESRVQFSPSQPVTIIIGENAPLEALILRRQGKTYGCRFTPPMDSTILDAIVSAGPFAVSPASTVPQPEFTRWSRRVRIGIALGVALAGWSLIALGIAAVLG